MTELLKMSYKGVEFSSNPAVIRLTLQTAPAANGIVGRGERIDNVYEKAAVVSGEGCFFGDDAVALSKRLCAMVEDKSRGTLFAPGINPMQAYFTKFEYEINCAKNCVSYSFAFTQAQNSKISSESIESTVATQGENAFDIAYRTGVSVDAIMINNDYPTPFDIKAGEEVRLK